MSERQRLRCLLSVLWPLLLLSACAGAPPVPDDHYYRLLAAAPPAHSEAPEIPGGLKIDPITAYGIYRERALLYTLAAHPEELRQHRYHYWIDTPTRLIRDQLVDYLRASGVAGRVARSRVAPGGDLRLRLTLKRFERVILADGKVRVRVALSALFTDAGGQTVKTTEYARELAAKDASVSASVNAINQALQQIYAELLRDLRGLS